MVTIKDQIYNNYKCLVNMSYSELFKWNNNPCSKKASLSNKPIKRNLKLLSKAKNNWTDKDYADALRTISFIKRMRKVKRGKAVKGCSYSFYEKS